MECYTTPECSLRGMPYLGKWLSIIEGVQHRFGGMRDKSKTGSGIRDDRNFHGGIRDIYFNGSEIFSFSSAGGCGILLKLTAG